MIYLKKDYRTKSGNFYSKGKYNSLDELPKELQGSELLDIKKPEVEIEILKKKDIVEFNKTERTEFIPELSKELNTSLPMVPEEVKIKINSATIEEISSLKGIGKVTAKKVTELRETSPFSSVKDLDERVPLYGSNSWTKYHVIFEA